MKGDTRCIDGTLWRHDPQPDDPSLETNRGKCPECDGKGCAPAVEKAPPPALGGPYWIVMGWNPRRGGKPFYRHATEAGANTEAQRLADVKGTRFRVFEAKGTFEPQGGAVLGIEAP